MELAEIIRQRIRIEGPISFHDFMEMCLYHPGCGYYTSPKEKIGKKGDYYTSSSITPLFGAMIARQLEEMWKIAGKEEFTVVEYGAGTGILCRDILQQLEQNREFYSRFKYNIVEKSPFMKEKEKGHLAGKVSWFDSIREISPFTGCILSNELLDNFAVHQVIMQDELMEIFVSLDKEDFIEVLRPVEKKLVDYFSELYVTLPRGFRAEINLEAIEWIKDIASVLKKGYIMTIDYGYTSSQLYRECRKEGTLLCYYKHAFNDQPYYNIGEQDITSHVNFSALARWGVKYGLIPEGYTSQAAFLLSLGGENFLRQLFRETTQNMKDLRKYMLLRHTLLIDMGQKFNVLIQRKGVPRSHLTGVRYQVAL